MPLIGKIKSERGKNMADLSIFSLVGKIAVVFGVTDYHSLGWGCAQALTEAGATPLITYQGKRAEEDVLELAKSIGAPAMQMDLRNPNEVEAVFKKLSEMGGLDIMIHTIAYAPLAALRGRLIDNTSAEDASMAMDVSAFSLVKLSKMAAPMMIERGGGSIIALTYKAGEPKVYIPYYNVMAAVKAALVKYAEILAVELGPNGIRVNTISSGAVRTASSKMIRGFTALHAATRTNAPLRRANTPLEVGHAAVFLSSSAASGITGVNLHVDCGDRLISLMEPTKEGRSEELKPSIFP